MKNKIFIGLIAVGLSMSILTSCSTSDKKNKITEKELELQKRELDLKQKELELKEKELAEQSKILIDTKSKTTKPKTDPVSTNKSKYTASGIIKSVEYERNDSWYISIVTPTANKVMIFINPRDSEWDKVNLMNLKEGVKIGVIGEWKVWGDGTKGLNAKKIVFL